MNGWSPTGRVVRGKKVFRQLQFRCAALTEYGLFVERGVRRRLENLAARKRHKEQGATLSAIMFPGVFIPPNFKAWWWKV